MCACCELCGGDGRGAPPDAHTALAHRRLFDCPGGLADDNQRKDRLCNRIQLYSFSDAPHAYRPNDRGDPAEIIRLTPVPDGFSELCGREWHTGPTGRTSAPILGIGLIPDCRGRSPLRPDGFARWRSLGGGVVSLDGDV